VSRALIFDCDGVLADTERDGHLVAFNQMWREQGVNWQWTVPQYAEKLKIGGGKERIASLARDDDFRAVHQVPASEDAWLATVAGWHKRKSEIFKQLVMSGALPGRPGVQRLAREAGAQGWTLAVCSTSALASVQAVLQAVMGDDLAGRFAGVFAGDIVNAKKPAPDIYNHAADALDLSPGDCVVIEDSRNGLLAATAAGMACIVTQNALTEGEDFSPAALVVDSLGDRDGQPVRVIANRSAARPSGVVTVADLEAVVAGPRTAGNI
jgi:HAD superfamily hydrolase (TIGR01509 family)